MKEALAIFLSTSDLNLLWKARNNISFVTQKDETEIIRILDKWANLQAVANLLMYPDLIPASKRADYVLAGLSETRCIYLVLASVVGLEKANLTDWSPNMRSRAIHKLVSLTKSDIGVIAERASVFVAERLWQLDEVESSQIIELLEHPSRVVQYNALVALIPWIGLENIRQTIDEAVEQGKLSEAGKRATEEKLSNISGFADNNKIDSRTFDLNQLSAPLLAYIPNLDELSQS
jgi:hypothetical protein